jgi:hypothetical protein
VHLDAERQIRYWTERFGATPQEVQSALDAAGCDPAPEAVERRLNGA